MAECCAPEDETAAVACCGGTAPDAGGSCCTSSAEPDAPTAAPCCGGATVAAPYTYGPQPFEVGTVDTFAGPIPRIATELSGRDARGELRVRLAIRRSHYRVRPGLYAVGEPDDTSPVLVTSNFKLTFDVVRRELTGQSLWLLVLDTVGVNVWCAAGKGTFSTAELVARMRAVGLEQVVSHRRLILPQLGATGVAGHEVRARTGFTVTWGPVRATDIPSFLAAGNKTTPQMRRVTFTTRERALLTGVELSVLWSPKVLAGLAATAVFALAAAFWAPQLVGTLAAAAALAVAAVIAGSLVVPVLLPWVPGRMFALKGALAGAVIAAAVALAFSSAVPVIALVGLSAISIAIASYVAMNFTGTSTFTSPSGVEWEMRRAIPWQIVGVVGGFLATVAGVVVGWGG